MFAGYEDITDAWGGPGALLETEQPEDEPRAFAYEFALFRSTPIDSSEAALVAAESFARGAREAGYSDIDVTAVIVRMDTVSGFPVAQVIFRFVGWEWLGDIGKLNAAVNATVVRSGLATGIGSVRVLRLSSPEARVLTTPGGIAPLFLVRDGGVSSTKAAVTPNPKQILSGDVRSLPSATPLASKPGGISQPVEDDEDGWKLLALLGIAAAGTFLLMRNRSR